jgi:hypothetical protein
VIAGCFHGEQGTGRGLLQIHLASATVRG